MQIRFNVEGCVEMLQSDDEIEGFGRQELNN